LVGCRSDLACLGEICQALILLASASAERTWLAPWLGGAELSDARLDIARLAGVDLRKAKASHRSSSMPLAAMGRRDSQTG
jgi:uncharacterized protein YjbI with pentapeptide repeats